MRKFMVPVLLPTNRSVGLCPLLRGNECRYFYLYIKPANWFPMQDKGTVLKELATYLWRRDKDVTEQRGRNVKRLVRIQITGYFVSRTRKKYLTPYFLH